jgi:hypothetical protein
MKILSCALLLMASLAFVLLGCLDNSSPIVVPTDQAVSTATSSSSLAKGGVLHSVTGSGRISIFQGGPYNELWTFSAIQHSIDEFSGEVNYHDWEVGYRFHGKIIDVKVDEQNHQAKLGWRVTHGTIPEELGTFDYIFIVIQDNGKGEDDWASWGWGGSGLDGIPLQGWIDMTPSQFMAELTLRGAGDLWVYTHGNFQIR